MNGPGAQRQAERLAAHVEAQGPAPAQHTPFRQNVRAMMRRAAKRAANAVARGKHKMALHEHRGIAI